MKSIKRICAVLIGFVFFGAGTLKLMDPVGTGLIVGEYFKFLHLGFLAPASGVFGVAIALLETLLGAALISGVFPVVTGAVSGVVLLLFTALTFAMWRLNPPMECGCFGEAIHLTHLQSFLKNLVLCMLWAVAFIPPSAVRKPRKVKYVSMGIATVSVVLFAVWSMLGIPPIDFTPFAPGALLMQADAEPGPDSPLLSVCNADGEYCDEALASGDLLLFTVYDVDRLSDAGLKRISEGVASAAGAALTPLIVASAEMDGADYSSDRRTLMTVNRSNGGATLLRDGMVVAKWSSRFVPDADALAGLMEYDATEAMVKENTPKRLKLQGYLLYVFAVLLLL